MFPLPQFNPIRRIHRILPPVIALLIPSARAADAPLTGLPAPSAIPTAATPQTAGAESPGARAAREGRQFLYGDNAANIPRDYNQARARFQAGADLGDTDCLFGLALLHEKGLGCPPDPARARDLLLLAAEKQHLPAQLALGRACRDRTLPELSRERIVVWLKPPATAKNAFAALLLAQLLEQAPPETRDHEAIVQWYTVAAQSGLVEAMVRLGVIYHMGEGVLPDYNAAADWLIKAQDAGSADAIFHRAGMYMLGHGETKDIELALTMYDKAAQMGSLAANYQLGMIFKDGFAPAKIPPNGGRAVQFFTAAATKGHVPSAFWLGDLYYNGEKLGVKTDLAKALQFFRQSAEGGHPDGAWMTGLILAQGYGCEKNLDAARKWLTQAKTLGYPADAALIEKTLQPLIAPVTIQKK